MQKNLHAMAIMLVTNSQLLACHCGAPCVPLVVADGAPNSIFTHIQPSFLFISPIRESQIISDTFCIKHKKTKQTKKYSI